MATLTATPENFYFFHYFLFSDKFQGFFCLSSDLKSIFFKYHFCVTVVHLKYLIRHYTHKFFIVTISRYPTARSLHQHFKKNTRPMFCKPNCFYCFQFAISTNGRVSFIQICKRPMRIRNTEQDVGIFWIIRPPVSSYRYLIWAKK